MSDSGPSPQATVYIGDPPRCPEHWPELAADGSRGPALSVCLSVFAVMPRSPEKGALLESLV